MKKLLLILLVLTYGLSATGATVHLHYCCGKLDKISLSTEHNKDCPQKESSLKSCCDNKQVDLKLKADQEPSAKWLLSSRAVEGWPHGTIEAFLFPSNDGTLSVYTTGPPVHWPAVPLYIRNRVFRI